MLRRRASTKQQPYATPAEQPCVEYNEYKNFSSSTSYGVVKDGDVNVSLLQPSAEDDMFAPGWELYGEASHPGASSRMSNAVSNILPKGEDPELYLIGVDVDFEEVEEMLIKAPVATYASVDTRVMHSNFVRGMCTDVKSVAFLNGTVAAFDSKSLMQMLCTVAIKIQRLFRQHLARGGMQRKLRVLQKFLKRGVRVEERIIPNRMRTRTRWLWTDQVCSQLKIGRQNGRDASCETSLDFRNITTITQVPNNGEGVAYSICGTNGTSKKKVVSVTIVIEEGGHGLDEALLSLVLKKKHAPLTAKQLVKRVSGGDVNDWFVCT